MTTVYFGELTITVPDAVPRTTETGEVRMVSLTRDEIESYEAAAFEEAAQQRFGITFAAYRARVQPAPEGGDQ